ncbi:hypothetical protein BO83DRAFT_392369 [Aspergillus eucalypticola CBS 122712]|uniref:RHS repeat protein n=1 Tax=Aspergillus eucalypticola (strain CBS 122712 / IBT 29274) TaxID=1448314 RepID=A0A317US33_ASPEC|nr:uncharacterized protein BO83DRAFT_392369 [Aspergillus eucalypticola CBS 122712]PWY64833.1 hypothetical protein BO83DRAFT_392369 [Aspergillus eucalypticola CBS 122712]
MTLVIQIAIALHLPLPFPVEANHTSDGPGTKINSMIDTFPSGGVGRFGDRKTFYHVKSVAGRPANRGPFRVSRNSMELESQGYVAIVFTWFSTGPVHEYQSFRIAQPKDLPSEEVSLVPADLIGTSLSDWLVFHTQRWSGRQSLPCDFSTQIRGFSTYHDDDSCINRLLYSNSILKMYSGALVNRRGRGWQGFKQVQTYDQISNSTTSESFLKKWPLTGCAESIYIGDGRLSESRSLSKQTFEYDTVSTEQGSWKIFKIHRTADLRNYLSDGIIDGQSGTRYSYDEESNVIEEEVRNSDSSKYWTKFSYQKFQNLVPLRACKKVTLIRENHDFEGFEKGDISMTRACYDANSGILTKISEWSSSVNQFTSQFFEFDEYGNEVKIISALGLETCTNFDSRFHIYPIAISECGQDVRLPSQSAYDCNTGAQIATLKPDGSLTCSLVDSITETEPCEEDNKAMQLLSSQDLVRSQTLAERLSTTSVSPYTDVSVKFHSDSNGAYILASTISSHNPGPDGRVESLNFIDCRGMVRKTAKTHGCMPRSWVYSEYDSRGCNVLQSFATKLPGCQDSIAAGLEWMPDRSTCVTTTFDALKRHTSSQTRPSHQGQDRVIDTRLSYLEGGKTVQITFTDSSGATFSKTEKHYARINGKEKMVAMVDENGSRTTYNFDPLGHLTRITDPAGKIESRVYGSLGNLEKTCDPYRGTETRQHDLNGNIMEKINAVGEKLEYSYDCKGRVRQIMGHDRRVIYEWNSSGLMLFKPSRSSATERLMGRILAKTVHLPFHHPYRTVYAYDYQDQIVAKTLLDGSKVLEKYSGALLSESDLHVDDWQMEVDTTAALLNEEYKFNNLDRLSSTCDTLSDDLTKYTYQAGRLSSVKTNEDLGASYTSDASGNIMQKRDMEFQYLLGNVLVTAQDGKIARVQYDAAGRMVRRTVNGESFAFYYDDFGHMSHATSSQRSFQTDPSSYISARVLRSRLTQMPRCRIRRKFYGADRIVGVLWSDPAEGVEGAEEPSYSYHTVEWFHTNTKGNITRVFRGNGALKYRSDYSPFGQAMLSSQETELSAYEGKTIEAQTGLLDFDARWYDTLLGRFATPDDTLDEKSLSLPDGMNWYAIENNGPINHIDPTGHWSWKVWTGLGIGAALVIGGLVALATLPVSLPAAVVPSIFSHNIITGAALGAGGSALEYSWGHREDSESNSFRLDHFATHTSVGATIANNLVDQHVWGQKNVRWSDGLVSAMITGAVLGVLSAGASAAWADKTKGINEQVTSAWKNIKSEGYLRRITKALRAPAQKLLRGARFESSMVNHSPLD